MNDRTQILTLAATIVVSALLGACASTPAEVDPSNAHLAKTTTEADQSKAELDQSESKNATDKSPDIEDKVEVASDVRCRRVRKTGTHMYTKVCTTAKQREEMKEEAKRYLEVTGKSAQKR